MLRAILGAAGGVLGAAAQRRWLGAEAAHLGKNADPEIAPALLGIDAEPETGPPPALLGIDTEWVDGATGGGGPPVMQWVQLGCRGEAWLVDVPAMTRTTEGQEAVRAALKVLFSSSRLLKVRSKRWGRVGLGWGAGASTVSARVIEVPAMTRTTEGQEALRAALKVLFSSPRLLKVRGKGREALGERRCAGDAMGSAGVQ
jgi:predicted RNA binding protein with dsRBD fold (UPF0201 family)